MNKINIYYQFCDSNSVYTCFHFTYFGEQPIYAQSDGDGEDDASGGSSDYEEFVNCLAQSEGDKGFATEDEIRDCFRLSYDPQADANSVASDNSNRDSGSDCDGSNSSSGNDDNLAPNTNGGSGN